MPRQPRPDCCAGPDLEVIHRVWGPPGPVRELHRCRGCGVHWRFDTEERMNFDGEPDHYWEWYTRLTHAEADALRETPSD